MKHCSALCCTTTDLFYEIGQWAHRQFPQSTTDSRLEHFRREFEELKAAPDDGAEMADLIMILCHQAYEAKIDLVYALRCKFEVVQHRKYGPPDSMGVVEHIR